MPESLRIVDIFWTLQGEGAHVGRRALFVRLPFCNLKCTWCDTEFTKFKEISESEFTKFVTQEKCKFAVITGGEPMMNKQTPRIVAMLKQLGFEIACETNGMFPIVDGIDFVTVSPKRFSEGTRLPGDKVELEPYYISFDAWKRAHEFKYVVDAQFDFSVLDEHTTDDGRRYSLSPEYGHFQVNVDRIIEFIKMNPAWRLSLQTHKIIGVA